MWKGSQLKEDHVSMGRRFEFIFQGLSSNRRRRFGSRVLVVKAFYEGACLKD